MNYIPAKTLITRTKNSYWFGTDYNMNIYKGCCHGCIYCDSRSDCYGIDNFDTVRAKDNSSLLLQKELKSKIRTGVIGTGAMSDPYNPFEEKYELTRNALKIIDNNGFGIAIATKSSLICRDIDILQKISKHSPVICKITITTFDDNLSSKIEQNVNPSSKRFEAIDKLSSAGLYSGILLMPILPYINDNEENIINIVRKAHECGAKFIFPSFGVTLRSNQRNYYFKKLDESFPSIKSKYISQYKNSYACGSPNAKRLYHSFKNECEKLGLLYKMNDIISDYKSKYIIEQISLF